MPKTTKSGQPKRSEIPSTLQKSSAKAQRTFTKAYDSAYEQYGDEGRAHQVAYSALKRTFEKVGDHWEKKPQSGPSDDRAAGGRSSGGSTAGGVDTRATKKHLYAQAKKLDIDGRSTMTKDELIDALQKESERRT